MATSERLHHGPDPTVRTIEQITLLVSNLREVVFTRLDAMDKAISVAHENVTRIPTDTDKQISHLSALTNEKFAGVANQFLERDVRVKEAALSQTTAVNAALRAQKEAQGKIEEGMVKQVDQIRTTLNQMQDALNDKINGLESRLTRQEASILGASGATTARQASGGYVASIVFGVIGVVGLVAGVLVAFIGK